MDAFDAMLERRSTGRLTEPGPTDSDLESMIQAAVSAPDHMALRPWRFIILKGDAKARFGAVMADALVAREPNATSGQLEKERNKLSRAPLVIVVAKKHIETSIPDTELLCAAAAATQNLLIAATALGYGSMWRTGDAAYDGSVKVALGLSPRDHIVGFIYVGTLAVTTPAGPTATGAATTASPHISDISAVTSVWT